MQSSFVYRCIKWSLFLFSLIMFSCISQDSVTRYKSNEVRDLADILADGKLVAVTDYNSASYYIYKGEPMGYQFDMLRDFASFLGVKLELIAENDIQASIEMLESREVDLIANNLTITAERLEELNFTLPHGETRQVVVQRNGQELGVRGQKFVHNSQELAGKVVYVQRGSASAKVVKDISEKNGDGIVLVELPGYDAFQLIDMVAQGKVDYVVCDEVEARVKVATCSNLSCEVAVSGLQPTAWAVRPTSPELLKRVNLWLENYLSTSKYARIHSKYYGNPLQARRMSNDFFYVYHGKVSQWDEYFKHHSEKIGWDWRLLASMVYQESHFDHNAVSPRGAVGLMQFMPTTADYFGIALNEMPIRQIEAGVGYLKWIEDRLDSFNIPKNEEVKFVLAAYNAGIGHVLDARNLARKYGRNPNIWDDNVEYFISNKAQFAGDPVVKYGSLKGKETTRYVEEIMERYQHYQNIVVK
jgi:membrane-bound lytic murein transglycosylase F